MGSGQQLDKAVGDQKANESRVPGVSAIWQEPRRHDLMSDSGLK
jgi:hypothetical protein